MGRYLIRRFAELILTVFLIATATFFLLEAVPGDPLTQRADHLPEQTRTALYQRYGLDKPVMERYLITMKKCVRVILDESFVYAVDSNRLVKDKASSICKTWYSADVTWCNTWFIAWNCGGR